MLVQAFYPHGSLKVGKCLQDVRFVVAVLSQYLEGAFLGRVRSDSSAVDH